MGATVTEVLGLRVTVSGYGEMRAEARVDQLVILCNHEERLDCIERELARVRRELASRLVTDRSWPRS